MQKETLKERVYRGIYEAVTNGEYRPNDILTENQMIEKFGVSKSPVREALVELCKDGVLINIPRMGYQVRAVTLKEIMDILEFRVDVEVGGLRKSFPVLTRENINMLRMIAEKHNADEDRIVSNNWQRNYEFHTYLYSLNNNVYGHQALQQMIHQCSRYISQYFLSAWQRKNESNGRYHMAVVDALEKQNIEEACVYLEKDILAVKEEILIALLLNLILLVLGCIMDMAPIILIATPILLPIATSIGIDPIQFGIMVVLNCGIGLLTPPVGAVLFIGSAVSKVPMERVVKATLPIYVCMIITLLLITFIPAVSMWLPSVLAH